MNSLLFLTVFLGGLVAVTEATSCSVCTSTYKTERDKSGATNTTKCAALKSYVACLETSQSTDDGCLLSKANADMVDIDFERFGCLTMTTTTCIRQMYFWGTYVASGDTTSLCKVRKTQLSFLATATPVGCDGSTTKDVIATKVDTERKKIPYCQDVTDTCECEIEMAKTDVSTSDDLCLGVKKELGCLATASSKGCDGNSTKASIGATAYALRPSSCTVTDTCQCEITAAKASASNWLTHCSVLDTLHTCVNDVDCRSNRDCSGLNNRDERMEEVSDVQKENLCFSSGVDQARALGFLLTTLAILTIGLTN